MNRSYKKFNSNILFLLNALDNGDYSFHFSETKLSRRERELNEMLNHIKEILTHARKEVIENEKFLSIIVESVSVGIIIVDERGIVHRINRPALSMLSLPNFTHLNQLKEIKENLPEQILAMDTKENIQFSVSNEKEESEISIRVSYVKFKRGTMRILTLNNIGNELETKEMESWIRLIRVMTHEIMNSIAPITSLSETLLHSLYHPNSESSDTEMRNNILEAFETIHSTAKGLLSFVESYRKFTAIPLPEKKIIPIKTFLEKQLNLFEAEAKRKQIKLTLDIAPGCDSVFADESQIHQVLVNLIKNAMEAANKETGKIKICVSKNENQKIRIDVINNGLPISQETFPHIFIPFFTTKSNGSGIGLSLSRYIMRLHNGKLTCLRSTESETVFSLLFH